MRKNRTYMEKINDMIVKGATISEIIERYPKQFIMYRYKIQLAMELKTKKI